MNTENSPRKVLIIGGGAQGCKLLDILSANPGHEVIGVADGDQNTPARQKCQDLGIPFATDFRPLVENYAPQVVIDLSGDPQSGLRLRQILPPEVKVLDQAAARLIFELITSREVGPLRATRSEDPGDEFIIGNSPVMQEVALLVAKVAPTPTPVLIRGETGTGKEVVAQAIHRQSHLAAQPFVVINCTALTTLKTRAATSSAPPGKQASRDAPSTA